MKIAIVSMIRDAWGGSEELWYEMAKAGLDKNIEFLHVGYEYPVKHTKIIELEKMGMKRIDRPGWIPQTNSIVPQQLYLAKNFLRKKVRSPIKKLFKESPDVIIYNGTCYSIANEKELIEGIRKTKTPFYIIGHLNVEGSRPLSDGEAERIRTAYELCQKVFFVSERNLDVARRHLCTPIKNAALIRNPVNMRDIDAVPFPSLNEKVQLASVGNLVTIHKGQDILLQALSKVKNKNWHLNIYGSGADETYLKELSSFLQIKDHVTFHGIEKDVRKIWAQNHCLLLSSHMEGMPLVVVEAMLCGRICIATDVGGISEWISAGKNGFLSSATIDALHSTIEKALTVKDKWELMGIEARQAALKLYDPYAGNTLLNIIINE